jgi:hypothetical protein
MRIRISGLARDRGGSEARTRGEQGPARQGGGLRAPPARDEVLDARDGVELDGVSARPDLPEAPRVSVSALGTARSRAQRWSSRGLHRGLRRASARAVAMLIAPKPALNKEDVVHLGEVVLTRRGRAELGLLPLLAPDVLVARRERSRRGPGRPCAPLGPPRQGKPSRTPFCPQPSCSTRSDHRPREATRAQHHGRQCTPHVESHKS